VTSNYTAACPERSRRNPIYELTQVTQATTTTESYTYDAVGNRLSSLGVSPYSVNVSNELTSTPSTTYTYDYNGNTATKVDSTGTTTYAWDFENRLTSVTLPGSGGTVSFAYDPFGRRIKKVTSSTTSVFAYDGDNLVEETNAAGAVVARYEDTQNIDEPLAMLRGGATSYYHADGLGSVTSLSNGTGSLAQTYGYDSFGKQTSSSGSLTNPFQYTARESDTETRLYYYRARYYDPNTGRFVSEDPVDFEAGTNFYDYVANDPTVFIDPWGLWHCVAGIDCNITPDLKNALECFDKCTNGETVVTSARRPPSPKHPNGSHSRGEACDLNRANNPGVTRPDAERCRKQCFANGYGQEENNRPDYKPQNPDDPSTHYHFQLRTVPGAQPGFGQGIKPYNP
jgi:RHS repeat-associated protein